MALRSNGKRFCNIVYLENGHYVNRTIRTLTVQAADGRVHCLRGRNLPYSLTLDSQDPRSGAHSADVLLSPKDAKGIPLSDSNGLISQRDVLFMGLGFFFVRLISALAEAVAYSIS